MTHRFRLRTCALASLLWLAAAGPASADKLVSVMTLLNEGGDDTAALELTDALRAGARGQDGWHLNETNMSLSQLGLVHDCEPTAPACLEVIAEAIDAGLLLVGSLEPGDGQRLVVRLRIYERGAGFREAVASGEFTPGEVDYGQLAMSLLRQLDSGESEPDSEGAPAPVPDPQPRRAQQDRASMADIETSVATPGDGSLAWLGYTLLGVGAASLGLVAYSWVKINEAQEDTTFAAYRGRVGTSAPEVSDVCAEARAGNGHGASAAEVKEVEELCDQGETFDILQYVFMGTAVVAGAAGGIVLWQEGGGGESARLTLSPHRNGDRYLLQANLTF